MREAGDTLQEGRRAEILGTFSPKAARPGAGEIEGRREGWDLRWCEIEGGVRRMEGWD